VNNLSSEHDIIHLDEESILTKCCVISIINGIDEGKKDFAQGPITYANYGSFLFTIKSLITNSLDMNMMADDTENCC